VSGSTPSNTLDAAVNLVHNPGSNVATLFGLAAGSSAFQPVLASAPSDWTLFISFTGAGMNEPAGIGVDSNGNIWVSSYVGVVSEFSPIGQPQFANGITGYGLDASYGLTIDSQNNIWVPNETSPSSINSALGTVTVLNSSGQPLSGQTGFSQGGLNYPMSIAIDTNSTSWVVDYGNAHVTLLSSTGAPLSGTSGYAPPSTAASGLAFPDAVVVDANHNGWIANQGTEYITRVAPDGSQYTNVECCNNPTALAIDQRGYVWVSNFYGDSVSQVSSATNAVVSSGYTGGGIAQPAGLAIDGAGNVWVANFRGLTQNSSLSLSELAGSASSSPGQPISPTAGWGPDAALLEAYGIAIDPSGNVWVTNFGNNTLTEFVGMATPLKTPVIGLPQAP
jgi:sugar lactone lactonase YvrE